MTCSLLCIHALQTLEQRHQTPMPAAALAAWFMTNLLACSHVLQTLEQHRLTPVTEELYASASQQG